MQDGCDQNRREGFRRQEVPCQVTKSASAGKPSGRTGGIIAFSRAKCYNARGSGSWREFLTTVRGGIILASASPRRRVLMGVFGCPFEVDAPSVPEDVDAGAAPAALVKRLAREKANAVADRFPGSFVVAADTIVAVDHSVFGKPVDEADALRMLDVLRARWHTVWTGLAVRSPDGVTVVTGERTDVLMRPYTPAEAVSYVGTGDAMDKAAAYAIQHSGFDPVARVVGCYANVMGLPLCALYLMLRGAGCGTVSDPRDRCPQFLGIACDGTPGAGAGGAGRRARPTTRHNHPGAHLAAAPIGDSELAPDKEV